MEKLIQNVKNELKEIENQGINGGNLELASKLADILKDLYKAKEVEKELEEGGEEKYMRNYRDGEWKARGGYRDGGYNDYSRSYMDGRGGTSSGGGYGNPRMRDHIDRIMEGAEMYEYGKDRYQHGGTEERLYDGLEKLMYAICMFVESTYEFADSPEEKEIIRRHVQKMRAM